MRRNLPTDLCTDLPVSGSNGHANLPGLLRDLPDGLLHGLLLGLPLRLPDPVL